MRICGRLLRPSTLAERRLFLGHFGTAAIRVPRSLNPYAVARKFRRVLMSADLASLSELARRSHKQHPSPPVSPDVDVPEPVMGAEDVAVAAE